MDVARSWPGAERVRAPWKAFDRLLGNPYLHAEREQVYADMAHWLLRSEQPVIVIDWSDLKPDKSWGLLRAAVPVGGRTLPILDTVFPGSEVGSPKTEKQFLQRLQQIVPEGVTPILVTDAGYRAPWFRAVDALGWHRPGRLRNRTLARPSDARAKDDWVPSRALHELPSGHGTRDMGLMDTVRARHDRAPLVASASSCRKSRGPDRDVSALRALRARAASTTVGGLHGVVGCRSRHRARNPHPRRARVRRQRVVAGAGSATADHASMR